MGGWVDFFYQNFQNLNRSLFLTVVFMRVLKLRFVLKACILSQFLWYHYEFGQIFEISDFYFKNYGTSCALISLNLLLLTEIKDWVNKKKKLPHAFSEKSVSNIKGVYVKCFKFK